MTRGLGEAGLSGKEGWFTGWVMEVKDGWELRGWPMDPAPTSPSPPCTRLCVGELGRNVRETKLHRRESGSDARAVPADDGHVVLAVSEQGLQQLQRVRAALLAALAAPAGVPAAFPVLPVSAGPCCG
jgi:hypothetical protein